MSDDAGAAPQENPEKDRSNSVTGDEPMTGPQRSYLITLAQEAGEEVPEPDEGASVRAHRPVATPDGTRAS